MTRLLIIPSPFPFSNPTWELIVDELIRNHSAIGIGPRYGINSNNIKQIVRNFGPFDAIVCDPWFFFQSDNIPKEYNPKDLFDQTIPLFVSLMQYDLHNLSEDFILHIKNNSQGAIVAASSHDFAYTPVDDDFSKEGWLNPQSYSATATKIFDHKFMLMPHCIGNKEFRSLNYYKKYDLIIPGVKYHFRKKTIAWSRSQTGISIGNSWDTVQKILSRTVQLFPFGASLSRLNRPFGVELYRRRFIDAIAKSRVAVTCDGTINYPIRKFFEIPACGTILAAKFFDKPERLGFQHRENCFSLDEERLDDLKEIIELSRSDGASAARIRSAGQEMVRGLHHVTIRAQQLRDLCGAIASGSADTVSWHEGRPIFQTLSPSRKC